MTIIEDKIVTSSDKNSNTVLFRDHTPPKAYDKLTHVVYVARKQLDYIHINLEKIPPNTEIGKAKYDDALERVIHLDIYDSILEEYGVKSDNRI